MDKRQDLRIESELPIRNTVKSQYGSAMNTPKSNVDNAELLQQMQDRLMSLSAENNRIYTLLQDKERNNKALV